MLKSDYDGQDCSVARSLEAVGERWTLLIIRELLVRPRRFSQLERSFPIAKNTLASRLEKLALLGILAKPTGSSDKESTPYRLTQKGYDLFPVVNALMAWGDRHQSPDGPPVIAKHTCGSSVGHRLVCACCGDDVELGDITFARAESNGETSAVPAGVHPSKRPPNG